MAQPIVATYTKSDPHLVSLLSSHLPHSLPLLRRLQFTQFPGGTTEYSRILLVGSPGAEDLSSPAPAKANGVVTTAPAFTAAYVDLSRGPETEAWLFSSIESCPTLPSQNEIRQAGDQLLALLAAIKELRDEYDSSAAPKRRPSSAVLFGTLNEVVRRVLLNRGCVLPYCTLWDKWVFSLDGLPGEALVKVQEAMAREGLRWDRISREDTALVISRTKIPRTEYATCFSPRKGLHSG